MTRKIKLELTPFCALTIASFLNEFKPEFSQYQEAKGLEKAYNEFYQECCLKTTEKDLEDANAEIEVNILLGNCPNRPNRK